MEPSNYTGRKSGEDAARVGGPLVGYVVRIVLATVFLLSTLPLGILWFVVLLALSLVGLALTIVWVGLPILALAMLLCALAVDIERRRLALIGVSMPSSFRVATRGPVLARLRSLATDPALWRGLAYLLLLLPVGLVESVVVVVLAFSVALATFPLWLWTLPEGEGVIWSGVFVADTVPEALVVMLVGLVATTATAVFVLEVARAHAALGRTLLGPSGRERLEERVEVLTQSRSRSVESAIIERRRIERDLHDGAQQRLVSLAMKLGMAREKLKNGDRTGDPDAASELVGEAHEEAKLALAEIRDLIRGIHPAILTDRGLDAAISALAGRSPVPVSVEVNLDEPLPEAVEITAYFVIAEALTNVARHSHASEVRVRVRRERDFLLVEIEDDGKGGADPAGAGLVGLADRVGAIDGSLFIVSPAGGPTRISAELPWGHDGERA